MLAEDVESLSSHSPRLSKQQPRTRDGVEKMPEEAKAALRLYCLDLQEEMARTAPDPR